jgi:DNA-binding transcriptional ArsR family regulator
MPGRHHNVKTRADGSATAELSPLAAVRGGAITLLMVAAANMVEIAALVGDTARATMLAALMGGQALTSSELASIAHISRSTASGHLGKLVGARLLAVTQKRRNRYYRIASPLVARMLESIKAVAAIETPARHPPRSAQDDALRFARTCYDHVAGRLGVAIADALIASRFIALTDDGGEVTRAGAKFLTQFGAKLDSPSGTRRIFCRACLDWSERRFHVAGFVGAEISRRCQELGWLTQKRGTRAVGVTPAGRRGLRDTFGVGLDFDARPTFGRAGGPRASHSRYRAS